MKADSRAMTFRMADAKCPCSSERDTRALSAFTTCYSEKESTFSITNVSFVIIKKALGAHAKRPTGRRFIAHLNRRLLAALEFRVRPRPTSLLSVFGLCEVVRRLEPKFRQPASRRAGKKGKARSMNPTVNTPADAPNEHQAICACSLAWPLSKSVCMHSPLPPFRNQNRPTTTQPVDKKSRCWISGSLPRTRPCARVSALISAGFFQFFRTGFFGTRLFKMHSRQLCLLERFVMEINAHYEFPKTVVSLKEAYWRDLMTWRHDLFIDARPLN